MWGRKKSRRKRKQYFIERWTLSVTGCRGSGGWYVFHRGFHLLPEARVQVNHLDAVRLVYFALVSVCGPLQGLSWKPG